MTVNNELGTIQPIEEIGQICFDNNIKFHTDAAQAIGKLDMDIEDMNIDFLSMSAHKFCGPKGIGALFIRDAKTANITPVIHGSGQEMGLSGGTLPTPLIVGMRYSLEKFKAIYEHALSNNLIENSLDQIYDIFPGKISFNGSKPKLPYIFNVTTNDVNISSFIHETKDKLCLSQGSACSSKEIQASHVLKAIGLTDMEGIKSFRVSTKIKST
jgi:cysteine desulfurase